MAISFQGAVLFKKTSTGKIQYWKIFSRMNEIVTQYGQVDGKEQETVDLVKEGKNEGRSNETTAEQQAYREAEARWTRQLKKGYVKTIEEAQAGKVDEIIEGGLVPMLAHKYSEQAKKIVYPAFASRKLDGHRCIGTIDDDGKAHLWSRTRKPITGLPHINKALEKLALDTGNIGPFDGELFNPAYNDNFEELTSFIRSEDPKPGHEVVQYWIYDLAIDAPFSERNRGLAAIPTTQTLVPLMSGLVHDETEMLTLFSQYVEEGFEGLMLRNAASRYENKRSYGLQKVKSMLDSEYEVVGVEAGRGKMADKAIFVCKTAAGTEFRAKMKGSLDSLKKYLQDPSLVVGKMVTVQYFGISNASAVPRFPVALRIREDL